MASEREHPVAPITRMAALAAVLISYPYWWGQGSALIDQVTHTILSLPAVTDGIHKLMVYAVDGVALGGWQLVDLGLMLAIGIELLMLMFLKVAIILVGALLYATGPLMLGLVPLESGAAVSRAWLAAAATVIVLPVLWATLFAVGGLLIDDAGTAGPLIAGNTAVGNLVGGLLLAVAGLATLWACLRAGREVAGLLRIQLGAMLAGAHALRGGPAGGRAIASTGQRGAQSVREFGQRVSRATGAAGQALAQSGPRGARIARAGGLAMTAGRRGLLGSAGLAAAAAGRQLVGYPGHARAGVVAMQMARAGCSYKASTSAAAAGRPTPIRQPPRAGSGPGGELAAGPARQLPPARGHRRCAPRTARALVAPRAEGPPVFLPQRPNRTRRRTRAIPRHRHAQRHLWPQRERHSATEPTDAPRRRRRHDEGQAMTPTLRRLGQSERWLWFTWRGWLRAPRSGHPVLRGQGLPARLPSDRHDHAAHRHHGRHGAVGAIRAGVRA